MNNCRDKCIIKVQIAAHFLRNEYIIYAFGVKQMELLRSLNDIYLTGSADI